MPRAEAGMEAASAGAGCLSPALWKLARFPHGNAEAFLERDFRSGECAESAGFNNPHDRCRGRKQFLPNSLEARSADFGMHPPPDNLFEVQFEKPS